MGMGMIALGLLIPAIVVAVILAFWFAISAARAFREPSEYVAPRLAKLKQG
jgi:hypothetical protein